MHRYGHFCVVKMVDLAAGSAPQRSSLASCFRGRLPQLMRHPAASAVLERVYSQAPPAERQHMAAEFYSPEYRLFKGSDAPGAGLLAEIVAAQGDSVLQHAASNLQPILEKGIVDHSLVHRVLVEYLPLAPEVRFSYAFEFQCLALK